MKRKVIVRGPALSRSGYGEHVRFVLRALRSREDLFDVYLLNINWGNTGWIWDDDEERRWMDSTIHKTLAYIKESGTFDLSVQVTIPNEFERMAPVNIGVTAGIETTKVAPQWIEKSKLMDKIVTVSEFSKEVFLNTVYEIHNEETGQVVNNFRCNVPIEVVHYPVRDFDPIDIDLDLEYDFNFLTVAQISPRKNMENTIKWFVEKFKNEEVGLVIKANIMKDCTMDRLNTEQVIANLIEKHKDRKCKVYLLHGTLENGEMSALYKHPKIKAYLTLAHGEGFGLPIFEAAYNELPIIAPGWSGYCDFLYVPTKNKKTKKEKLKAHFANVKYSLMPVQKEAVWDGVIQEDSMWCMPDKRSYKARLYEVYKEYPRFKSQAKRLNKWIRENFSKDKQCEKFVHALVGNEEEKDYVFVSDYFAEDLQGGAELTLEALVEKCPSTYVKINSRNVNDYVVNLYKDKKWIIGNFTELNETAVSALLAGNVNYNIIEFDYKFCTHRSLELYEYLENKKYQSDEHCKSVETFFESANNVFFMSERQKEINLEYMPLLKSENTVVLSSVFSEDFFNTISALREEYKDRKEDKWIFTGSPFWIKGSEASEEWCGQENLNYEKIHDKSYKEALELLAKSKGFCCLPPGGDTCPRMVIEAKLLGCELHLNEHVQHKDEEWFNTDNLESIEEYLKAAPNRFWNTISGE